MYLLACNGDLKPIIKLIGWVVFLIQIAVPIALIIYGMIDLGKAVISSKEDEVKKATKAFGKRFLYAVGVFVVVWIVTMVMGWIPKFFEEDDEIGDTTSWKGCWACISTRGEVRGNCKFD